MSRLRLYLRRGNSLEDCALSVLGAPRGRIVGGRMVTKVQRVR